MRESAEHWEYDGSFLGFMTVVDRSFREKKFPTVILSPETAIESLFLAEYIPTDPVRGEKIYRRLQQRLRTENVLFIQNGFYATLEGKERYLLEAIEIALQTKDLLENHRASCDFSFAEKYSNVVRGDPCLDRICTF